MALRAAKGFPEACEESRRKEHHGAGNESWASLWILRST